jgi:hypothetical protein
MLQSTRIRNNYNYHPHKPSALQVSSNIHRKKHHRIVNGLHQSKVEGCTAQSPWVSPPDLRDVEVVPGKLGGRMSGKLGGVAASGLRDDTSRVER